MCKSLSIQARDVYDVEKDVVVCTSRKQSQGILHIHMCCQISHHHVCLQVIFKLPLVVYVSDI